MNILIAPDSFKGSLTSIEVSCIIEKGILSTFPNAKTKRLPIADGGEGTLQTLSGHLNAKSVTCTVQDPLGRYIEAKYAQKGTLAIIEMAEASGIMRLQKSEYNPQLTTTFGTGELILHALHSGAKEIVLGIGGSATNDAGIGMLSALGVKFFSHKARIYPKCAKDILSITEMDISDLKSLLDGVKITVFCDVDNPLTGACGASIVYGMQKGASVEEAKLLDTWLDHYRVLLKTMTGQDANTILGAGAAGGIGASLVILCKAHLKSGIKGVLDILNFDKSLLDTDVVITGEGCIDAQSLYGKAISGVLDKVKKFPVDVYAIAGTTGKGYEALYKHHLKEIFTLTTQTITVDEAINNAKTLLFQRGAKLGEYLNAKTIKHHYTELLKQTKYHTIGNKRLNIKQEMSIFKHYDETIYPDIYGSGHVINDFEIQMAKLFGKACATFFVSGTMAQQIALRIWSDKCQVKKVAYHPLCHLEIHEQAGLKHLHHMDSILLGTKDRLFTLDDLKEIKGVSCVLFELPQREIGGQLPEWEALVEMVNYCKSKGFKVHLDGARIFECIPYYQKSLKEIGGLFDSIYISFYKGLGGISGAMLLADIAFMAEAKVWKRRYGGDLYHLYPYIVTAKAAYDLRGKKMADYYQGALQYAQLLSEIKVVSINPKVPVTNMFHVHFNCSDTDVAKAAIKVMQVYNIALFGSITTLSEGTCKVEVAIGDAFLQINKVQLKRAVNMLGDCLML